MEQQLLTGKDETQWAAPEDERATRRRIMDAADGIVQRLSKLASDTARKRKDIEGRWIEDMCQFAGVRTASEIVTTKADPIGNKSDDKKSTRSDVFVNITRPKTNRTEGRLCDILFPADDRNWGIQPTPSPELSIVAKRAMAEAQRAVDEANRLNASPEPLPSPTGLNEEELVDKARQLGVQGADAAKQIEEAKKRSDRMSHEIDDQLVEANYAQKSRDAIGWACKLGIGILKGPIVMDGGRTAWKGEEGEDGTMAYALKPSGEKARPDCMCVSPWAFFPDYSATSMADAEYVFERHLPSKRELRKMARKLGFYEEPLRDLLKDGPGLTGGEDFEHLRQMRTLTGESTDVENRYIVWEYHGTLECEEIATLLRAVGTEKAIEAAREFEDEYDPFTEHRVIAYFCNNKLLKLAEYYPMDSQDFIYSVFSLEKGAASILGAIGVPRMMRDSQKVLNAAWRMMMDNAKLSVGPQVLIDKKKVKPADGDWTMYPGKEWLWDSANSNDNVSPFQTFNIPMNQEQIAGIIALSRSFIDDETAMPSVIEGGTSEEKAPGAASTVGGFAMLLNSAGVNVRRMVKGWDDDVTGGMIRRFYDWNMQHSDKDEIKGDMNVEARGTSVLLQREIQAPMLANLATAWSTHPVIGPMLKAYDMVRLAIGAMQINPSDVMIEEDEFEQKVAELAKQTEPPDPQWEVRKEIAQIDADSRMAVAEMGLKSDMVQLSETTKISLTDILAKLEAVKFQTGSKERLAAAEIAVETRAAREAAAEGRVPEGSGGNINLATEPA